MRLDHLLSKETSAKMNILTVTSYRSVQVVRYECVIQFRGYRKKCTFKTEDPLWGVSSAGRAPALQAGGHRFDPGTLHQRSLGYGPIAQLARAHD